MSGEGTRFKIKDNMAQNGQIKPIQPNVETLLNSYLT